MTSSPAATRRALATVLAAKHRHHWGFFAARRYAERRGSTPLLWLHAMRIETLLAHRHFPLSSVPSTNKIARSSACIPPSDIISSTFPTKGRSSFTNRGSFPLNHQGATP